MTDEEVIKRRLIVDGDGTGDERRLNALHRSVNQLCNAESNPEQIRDILDRLLIQLSQCEFSVQKSRKVAAMNSIELDNYKNLSRKITLDIEDAKGKIEKTKEELIEAKRIRKNKMEYDVLGKVISKQPDRKQTEMGLAAVEEELSALRAAKAEVQHRLESRRRQFHGLVLMLHQLESTINEDDQPMDVDDDSDIVKVPESKLKSSS